MYQVIVFLKGAYRDFIGRTVLYEAIDGSAEAIEGIFSPDGRIYGRATRFSRVSDHLYENVPGEWDAKIFESGVKYFK